MNILYVGSLDERSNSLRRYNTLALIGHNCRGIDTDTFILGSFFTRFHYHLNMGPGISRLNNTIKKKFKEAPADILLVDNKTYVTASTLKWIRKNFPAAKIAHLITDDPGGRYSRSWRLCFRTAKYYDIHFVQREENVQELKAHAANRVELCYRSFDPMFHKPLTLDVAEKLQYGCKVGFVGTYEEERENFIVFLINNNVPVWVYGDGWPGGKHWSIIKANYKGASVYGSPYVKIINGMDIALHFLRKANRDQQDSRTFEIPACSVFMLAERSNLHEQFFKENDEAVFFETREELLEKIHYYLQHDAERKRIAQKGYERCLSSGYDHRSRLEDVILKILN